MSCEVCKAKDVTIRVLRAQVRSLTKVNGDLADRIMALSGFGAYMPQGNPVDEPAAHRTEQALVHSVTAYDLGDDEPGKGDGAPEDG